MAHYSNPTDNMANSAADEELQDVLEDHEIRQAGTEACRDADKKAAGVGSDRNTLQVQMSEPQLAALRCMEQSSEEPAGDPQPLDPVTTGFPGLT